MSGKQVEASPRRRVRVGVDIGGTFTDLSVVEHGRVVAVGKALTTPADPAVAVEGVFSDVLERLGVSTDEVELVVHGTTLVTNAILERRGARTALLATEGFRDVLEIARERRYELYDLMVEHARPLVPRHMRLDVPERVLADGSVAIALDEDRVATLVGELVDAGVEAVAVAFLHSFRNDGHERRAREIIHSVAPDMRVAISSEVVPSLREYERTSTTVANVYVQSLTDRYLGDLEERLRRIGFGGQLYVMLSSGGVATLDTAVRFPIRLLESGPAAGALAAATFGSASGERDLISFDMGGTTAKLCLVERGEPLIAEEFEVDRAYRFKRGSGLPVKIPVIDMIEIGVGGGSIAGIDALGLLKVGPESAGADPGPVCYGRGGTRPTVTDADLVLGYLDPAYFLGGTMSLDVDAAARAIEEYVGEPLGLGVAEAAWGIHRIVNESMATAARVHAAERGANPAVLPLFAFGGAGPVHAVGVAEVLGAPSVVAPMGAGVASSIGLLAAPLAFDFVRSRRVPLDEIDWSEVTALFEAMEAQGNEMLVDSGLDGSEISHRRFADMRYVGQGHEIRVELPDGASGDTDAIRSHFERAYVRIYGRSGPDAPIEAINWRVKSAGPRPELHPGTTESNTATDARKGSRDAYFPGAGGYVDTPVYDRYALRPGAVVAGPAIVEERESTVVVGLGHEAVVMPDHNLVISLGRAAGTGTGG
jgi:N-methylhydantoinase A